MTFLNRLGLRRRKSTKDATPPGDLSDDEVDLEVFDPFTQSDMGITPDGKPTSSFSSGSAYTVVDSPRMTMDDFLKRAQNAVADRRRPDSHRAATIDPAADRPPENRVAFSSDPELRRVAARNSLHRRFQAGCAGSESLSKRNSVVAGEHDDTVSEALTILGRLRPSRARPNVRPASLPEDETPDRSRLSFEYSSSDLSRRSLSLPSPKSRSSEPQTQALTPAQSFPEAPARPVTENDNAPTFSSSRNHSSLAAPVPSFQKIAGYKYELPQERTMRQSIRQAELLSIPSRPSPTITRHRDPPQTSKANGIIPAVNHVPEPTIKRSIEVAYMRRTSSAGDAKIKKEDPKSKQERMLNAATKRWSFWGSINRSGDDRRNSRLQRVNEHDDNNMFAFELGQSDNEEDDEDRTEAFRSIENADEQTRTRILDAHLEQIMEAATAHIKDKNVKRTVQIVDRDVRSVNPKRGLIESAREEVRLSACDPEQSAETSSKDGKKEMKSEEEEEKSSRRMSALMTRLFRRGSKPESETAKE